MLQNGQNAHNSSRAARSMATPMTGATAAAAAAAGSVPVKALHHGHTALAAYLPGRGLLAPTQHCRPAASLSPVLPLSTWAARYRYFFTIASPTRLLTTQSQLQDAVSFIGRCERGQVVDSPASRARLFEAVTTRDSMVHPDTGKVLPLPMRRAFFLPSNLPIFLGMLLAPQTAAWITTFQVLNNGYSTSMNYMNRNASSSQTPLQMAGSFSVAVGVSTGIAVQVRKFVDKLAKRPWAATVLGRAVTQSLVPFAAMATAGYINLIMARYGEVLDGVAVRDESGNVLGRSVIAGQDAVKQTIMSRILMPLLPATIPPLIMHGLQRYRPAVVAPFGRMVGIKTAVVAAVLTLGLPFSLAPFPYCVSRSVHDVEPHFAGMTNRTTGAPVRTVYYNRGL